MPKRDWLGKLTLALVAAGALLCAVAVVGAIMSEQYIKRHQASAEYQRNAETDRRAASHEIAEACQDRAGDAFRACISEHIEAYYRDQATNEDLQAQQDMAYWAGALFFSSTVLTGIGIFLLYGTLAATRETLREAENATAAANRNVDETRRIGEAQVRAYIGLANPRFIFEWARNMEGVERLTPFFICELENSGDTPAFDVRLSIEVGYAFAASAEAREITEYSGPRGDLDPLPPQTGYEVVADSAPVSYKIGSAQAALTDHEYERAQSVFTMVFVAVRAYYRDVFGEEIASHVRCYEVPLAYPHSFDPVAMNASGMNPRDVAAAIERGAFRPLGQQDQQ